MRDIVKELKAENKRLKEENLKQWVEIQDLEGQVAFYSRRDFDIQKYGSKSNPQTKLNFK